MKKLIISLMLLAFCPGFLLTGQAQTSKDQYAFDVFEDIIRAVNRSFPSPPKLVIVNNPNMVAVTSSDGTIQVSSTLIELMRGCGADSANALAHVLAHEVMHYYNEHFWAGNFALPYADAGWGEELQMIDSDTLQLQYQETQADLYGLFYATNAGYVTAPIADAVIDSIYRWFDLPFKMKHYPDLDARKGMARSAAEQVYAMIPSYEAGIYLLHLAAGATGNEQFTFLRGASSFFYHITDNYIRTREMLNNIAVVKIMEALTYFYDHLARYCMKQQVQEVSAIIVRIMAVQSCRKKPFIAWKRQNNYWRKPFNWKRDTTRRRSIFLLCTLFWERRVL